VNLLIFSRLFACFAGHPDDVVGPAGELTHTEVTEVTEDDFKRYDENWEPVGCEQL